MDEEVIVEFGFPGDVWEIIPRTFPTVDGTTEKIWLDRLVTAYVQAVGENEGRTAEIVTDLARGLRDQIAPQDVATVLFRPTSLPITVVVHIQLFEQRGVEATEVVASGMLPDIRFAIPPVRQPFSTEFLGEGTKAAFIALDGFPDGTAAGGLSYAFASEDHVINVQSGAARLDAVGILEQHLDAFVQTVRLSPGTVDGVEQVS